MPEEEPCSSLIGKCADVKSEIEDIAASLACEHSPNMASYIAAACLLKLACFMNSIAQKVYPLGDVCPPDERASVATTYWMGNVPRSYKVCDIHASKNSIEGSTLSVEFGSGSGSCEKEKWNIRITPATGDPFYIFADYVEQDTLCGKAVEDYGAEFSSEFEDAGFIISACSRIDVVIGDCAIGTGLRIDILGTYPNCP